MREGALCDQAALHTPYGGVTPATTGARNEARYVGLHGALTFIPGDDSAIWNSQEQLTASCQRSGSLTARLKRVTVLRGISCAQLRRLTCLLRCVELCNVHGLVTGKLVCKKPLVLWLTLLGSLEIQSLDAPRASIQKGKGS